VDIYKGLPIRNGGGVGWERVIRSWGVVASVCLRTMGRRGLDFCYFGAYVLIE